MHGLACVCAYNISSHSVFVVFHIRVFDIYYYVSICKDLSLPNYTLLSVEPVCEVHQAFSTRSFGDIVPFVTFFWCIVFLEKERHVDTVCVLGRSSR